MISLFKNIIVVLGLSNRTIMARFGLYKRNNPSNLEGNIIKPSNKNIQFYYRLLPKEISVLDKEKIKIHNKYFIVDELLEDKINKNDYLQTYTFHYLGFDSSVKRIDKQLIQRILDNNISNEPFVDSLQLFNLICDERYNLKDYQNKIKEKYYNLYRNIEFKVDGNHVLENLISLCMVELCFNSYNDFTFKLLIKELRRQTKNGFHAEFNIKYAKDLILKLNILIEVITEFNFKIKTSELIKDILNKWEKELVYRYKRHFYIHDNIDGDQLKNDVESFIKHKDYKIDRERTMFRIIPRRGMRGHSFDSKFNLPIGDFFVNFGTATYSNSKKRDYQRLRYNNTNIYKDKKDVSHFFFKSFRSVFMLPYINLSKGNVNHFIELIYGVKGLYILNYKLKISKESIIIFSKRNISLDLFCDNINDYRVEGKRIYPLRDNLPIIESEKVSFKKALRSNFVNSYKSTTRITFSGKSIKITLPTNE